MKDKISSTGADVFCEIISMVIFGMATIFLIVGIEKTQGVMIFVWFLSIILMLTIRRLIAAYTDMRELQERIEKLEEEKEEKKKSK